LDYVEEFGHAKVPTTLKYQNFNLGSWVSNQRNQKNRLNIERIKQLELLPQWTWNIIEEQWNEGFEYLKQYIEEFGHSSVPRNLKYKGYSLANWIHNQRQYKDRTDLKRIQLLESLPQWSWNRFEDKWDKGFSFLKKYVEEFGHAKVHPNLKYKIFNLGDWTAKQRYARNELEPEKIKQLESLPEWSWNLYEERWNKGFEYLKQYVNEHNHARVPIRFKYEDFNLGAWVSQQRLKKENLDLERIAKLESLNGWVWSMKGEK
jgi:hypothetical protein